MNGSSSWVAISSIPKRKNRRERYGGDQCDVIPRPLEWIVHGEGDEGQEQEPGREEAGGMAGVEEGHRRRQETLAPPQGVLEEGQVIVYLVLTHEVHGKSVDGHREIVQQSAVGTKEGGR